MRRVLRCPYTHRLDVMEIFKEGYISIPIELALEIREQIWEMEIFNYLPEPCMLQVDMDFNAPP